ncbi:MAG: MmgE/PrpD family protein [Deltaproteobacteria bacterium]|nr:MmgE/PrpD family protein [Deltaproteobacteria bacterium]
MSDKTIAEDIAGFGGELKFSDLPGTVVHEAKRRIIDAFGCAMGAYNSPLLHALRKSAQTVKDGGKSSIIGCGRCYSPDFAAFANGAMIRYLDFNDTYLSKEPAHPSDNIAPCLAASEADGRSGKDFITAVVAAYEVQMRLCDAASLRLKGFDHVTYGAFSGTLAASMLLGLNKKETGHALGMAGVASPRLRQTRAGEISMWKGCAFADIARNALFYATLAKAGITGPSPVFEGEFGLFKVITGEFVLQGLAKAAAAGRFKLPESYIKYYPAEYHAQSAITAAIELSEEIEDIESIKSITVDTFTTAYEIIGSGEEKFRPKTRETADHSMPFIVASAILDRDITVDSFSPERLGNARLTSLMDKITIKKDNALDAMYPEAMPNRVEVVLNTGDTLSKEVIYPKGHPKNALTDREVEEKFKSLAEWYFTGKEAAIVLSALWGLEHVKEMMEVTRLFAESGK